MLNWCSARTIFKGKNKIGIAFGWNVKSLKVLILVSLQWVLLWWMCKALEY